MCETISINKTNGKSPQATSKAFPDWEQVKLNRNLLEVARYISAHSGDEHILEAHQLYEQLRNAELETMRSYPWRYNRQTVEDYLSENVFTYEDFANAGLVTPDSWDKLKLNREYLPDIADYHKTGTEQIVPPGTDVYFFGMPTSGKSALMMGIAAANGQGFTLDMRTNGGPYAAALRQYTQAGVTPGRTPGKFVTTVSGNIYEDRGHGRIRNYPINITEMSGEEFALRIAETKEQSIANMGTGVTNLLRNDNRKVFFIIVDASRPRVKVNYLEHEIDQEGEISQYVKSRYISQLDILDKFIVLISLPENQEIMSHVDAIHFIVTKSDSRLSEEQRAQNAVNLINDQYLSVVEQLRSYCRDTRRINRSNDYEPQVFTYTLGKFYLGDVFDYDAGESLKIVDAIREGSASGSKYKWRKFCNSLKPV